MLHCIIVDDEKLSREVLCNYLKEYCTDVEVVDNASSVKSAYKAIRKHKPDFIFLDIEMADGKGFQLLEMFDKIDFKVIFVTAYSEYAVRAFRFSAVDYLLKPVKIDELQDAVEKVRLASIQEPFTGNLASILGNLKSGMNSISTIVINHLKGFDVLKIPEIIMCQADGYCTNFYLTANRKIVSSKNLKHFSSLLEGEKFIRIHHSYLINIEHVAGYSKQGKIFLTEGHKAYLGDSYKSDFINRFSRK